MFFERIHATPGLVGAAPRAPRNAPGTAVGRLRSRSKYMLEHDRCALHLVPAALVSVPV